MFPYCVVVSSPDESRITLKDQLGRRHLARALNGLPERGALLKGTRPHLGFGLLVCLTTGRVHRVIFETINSRDPDLGLAADAAEAVAAGVGALGAEPAMPDHPLRAQALHQPSAATR